MCIFCGNRLEGDTVLVEERLEPTIQAKLQVKNGFHEKLREKTILLFHLWKTSSSLLKVSKTP